MNDKNKNIDTVSATMIKELSDLKSKIVRVEEIANRATSGFFTSENGKVAKKNADVVTVAIDVAIDVRNENKQQEEMQEAPKDNFLVKSM